MAKRTQAPFEVEVPRLMQEQGLSLRALASKSGVDPTHLSRVLRGKKVPSAQLAKSVAAALELPPDFFLEVREHAVVSAVRSDPKLRESVYNRLRPTGRD